MLTITPEARRYIHDHGGIIHLEYLPLQGCCIPYQPGPDVRFGMPYNPLQYRHETVDGTTVFVPFDLPDVPLRINLNIFLGFKRLVAEGWRHA